jgi:hypothetical protein
MHWCASELEIFPVSQAKQEFHVNETSINIEIAQLYTWTRKRWLSTITIFLSTPESPVRAVRFVLEWYSLKKTFILPPFV